jgi:alpha-1,2-mannosyltransferase
VVWPVSAAVGLVGLVVAAKVHREVSAFAGLLTCAVVSLLVSPITWTHHMVWVVPVVIWLALADDAPRRARRWAAGVAVLFWAAPIWWVPTTWWPRAHPPELRQNGVELVAGNSFFMALVVFLVLVSAMVWRPQIGRSLRTRPAR